MESKEVELIEAESRMGIAWAWVVEATENTGQKYKVSVM